MKHRFLLPLLCTLALLGVAAAAVFGMGRIAEQEWQAPDSSPAPVVNDTAIEQVESELKAYPYQILTLSAAQILYKEIAQAGTQLTMRETGSDNITAAKAAALAGELAMTLYGSDLSEKTLDLLPVFWQPYGTSDTLALWLAAYTLPEAAQTASDGSAYDVTQGCWLFCLDAADGALLYSRCTAMEGAADEHVIESEAAPIPDDTLNALYRRTLDLADGIQLSADKLWLGRDLHTDRGIVQIGFLELKDGRACRMTFDEYYRTDSLYEIAVLPEELMEEVPPKSDRLLLPLERNRMKDEPEELPSAVELATQGNGLCPKGQSASYSIETDDYVYLSDYYDFAKRQFILCRIDPVTAIRSLLCGIDNCAHQKSVIQPCPARTEILVGADELTTYFYDFTLGGGATGNSVANNGVMHYIRHDYDEKGCRLIRRDSTTQMEETVEHFDVTYYLIGQLGDYLLLGRNFSPLCIADTEDGLQLHDYGWERFTYAYNLNTGKLQLVHQGLPETNTLLDIKNGKLWSAHVIDNDIVTLCRDLFNGNVIRDTPGFTLHNAWDETITHWETAGRYHFIRTVEDSEPRLYLADTVGREARELPRDLVDGTHALIATFGDDALIQETTATTHRYYFLSLPALFEGRVERRWVTDDFVIG